MTRRSMNKVGLVVKEESFEKRSFEKVTEQVETTSQKFITPLEIEKKPQAKEIL